MMIRFLCLVSLMFTVYSCTNEDAGVEENPEETYFDYKIWGDEEIGYVTTKLLFRKGGRNGSPTRLIAPAKVELDGQQLNADSSAMNGVYYEISHPLAGFAGKHAIEYTGPRGKEYREEFDFQPLTIDLETGTRIFPGDLLLRLQGVSADDRLRVILIDTAAFSEGVERVVDSVKNGMLVIDSLDIATLRPGPVYLEISREQERRVQNGTQAGGRISISYGIKRQFELAYPEQE